MNSENPYDSTKIKRELVAAGAPARLVYQQDLNPSVYFISALPLVALLAWLPWEASNIIWCLISLGFFFASLLSVLKHAKLSAKNKWIFASLSFLFCPTYVGLLRGNPSVLSISLVTLAFCFSLDRKSWMSGAMLGPALCLKPQIAICGVFIFAISRQLIPLFLGFSVLGASAVAGVLRAASVGQSLLWWQSEWHNMTIHFGPGGPDDPSPSGPAAFEFLDGQTLISYFVSDPLPRIVLLAIFAAALFISYWYLRHQLVVLPAWRDAGFFSALTILVTYHRYYDGQIFLLLIPLLVEYWNTQDRKRAIALGGCLLLLAFPDQTVFAKLLGPAAAKASILQFALVRHQPLAVLAIATILLLSLAAGTEQIRTCEPASPTRSSVMPGESLDKRLDN